MGSFCAESSSVMNELEDLVLFLFADLMLLELLLGLSLKLTRLSVGQVFVRLYVLRIVEVGVFGYLLKESLLFYMSSSGISLTISLSSPPVVALLGFSFLVLIAYSALFEGDLLDFCLGSLCFSVSYICNCMILSCPSLTLFRCYFFVEALLLDEIGVSLISYATDKAVRKDINKMNV